MAPRRLTKRTLPPPPPAPPVFGEQEQQGIALYREYLGLGEARLDLYHLSLGAIVLRCLLPGYQKNPSKRGFRAVLGAAFSADSEGCPEGLVRASKTARTFQLLYTRRNLPAELQSWAAPIHGRRRRLDRTSSAVFHGMVDSLGDAFNMLSQRLVGNALPKTGASLDRLISQETLRPSGRTALRSGIPADVPEVTRPSDPDTCLPADSGNAELLHTAQDREESGQPEHPSQPDASELLAAAEVGTQGSGDLPAPRDVACPGPALPAPVPARETDVEKDLCWSAFGLGQGRVAWEAECREVAQLPPRKTMQPDKRPISPRYSGYEQDIEPLLSATGANVRLHLRCGKTVAAVAGGAWCLPVSAQALLVQCLETWKSDPLAKVPGGVLHYGVKVPPGATTPLPVAELNRCGPKASGYVRQLEHLLFGTGTLAWVEAFSMDVCPRLLLLQKKVLCHLADNAVTGPRLPVGNAWEFRVINLDSVAAKCHCDPNDFGFTIILVLGTFKDHYLCVPELGVKLLISPGSMVALPSAYCDHFVSQFEGTARFSILFICTRSNVRHCGVFPLDEIEI